MTKIEKGEVHKPNSAPVIKGEFTPKMTGRVLHYYDGRHLGGSDLSGAANVLRLNGWCVGWYMKRRLPEHPTHTEEPLYSWSYLGTTERAEYLLEAWGMLKKVNTNVD